MANRRTDLFVCALVAIVTMADAAIPSAMDLPLLKQVASDQARNHAISPFLLSNVMSQVWLGARGNTRDEMTEVLGLSGPHHFGFLNAYNSTRHALSKPDAGVTTAIFNRIYIRRGFNVKPTFSLLLRTHYGVSEQRFSSNLAVTEAINTAVAQVTRDRITQLVTPEAIQGRPMVLVGALYFKAKWETKFDTVKPRPFVTVAGERDVPMMRLSQELPYASFPGFDAVSLPYKNPDYSLLILRPSERSLASANKLLGSLDTLNITHVHDELHSDWQRDVVVTMPPFKIETSYQLKEPMQNLGIRDLFSAAADLTGISDNRLFVSSVVHKVFMEVNEEGTEAAAAVALVFSATSFQIPRPPVHFTVDRPFLAVLYHRGERANLFSAWVANP